MDGQSWWKMEKKGIQAQGEWTDGGWQFFEIISLLGRIWGLARSSRRAALPEERRLKFSWARDSKQTHSNQYSSPPSRIMPTIISAPHRSSTNITSPRLLFLSCRKSTWKYLKPQCAHKSSDLKSLYSQFRHTQREYLIDSNIMGQEGVDCTLQTQLR